MYVTWTQLKSCSQIPTNLAATLSLVWKPAGALYASRQVEV